MRRPLVVLLILLLVTPTALGTLGAAGAVPDARLTVSGLAVAPEAPVTDEPVTVTATVQNSGGSTEPVTIDRVVLRTVDGEERLAAAENLGALSQGESLTVDLVTEFEEAGREDLEVLVVGTDTNENQTRAVRPLTVVVERAPPTIEPDPLDAVVAVENDFSVTVSNPSASERRNLELTLVDVDGERTRAIIPSLAAGASTTVDLSLRPAEAGEREATLTLAYTTSTGSRATTEQTVAFTAEPLREDVGVAVRRAPEQPQQQSATGQLGALLGGAGGGAATAGGGGGGSLQSQEADDGSREAAEVEVTNFGNVPVSEVVVRPVAGETELPRRSVGSLAPGESATVQVDLSGVDGATLTATVEYRYGSGSLDTATGTYRFAPATGDVRLTDVNLEFTEDGRLRITGNTGNIGDASVQAVVVAIGENEYVSPAYPQRDYFVGSVESSEFAPFELTADIDARNATEIPVRVTYRTGGEVRNETVTLPYDDSLAPEENQRGFSLGVLGGVGPAGALVGLLLVLFVLGPTVYLARRR